MDGLSTRGGGVDRAPWLDPPQKRGLIDGPPKILPRLTPGPRRWLRPKMWQKKMKMGFWESERQGGSEKSSFAIKLTIFNGQKIVRAFGARLHNHSLMVLSIEPCSNQALVCFGYKPGSWIMGK